MRTLTNKGGKNGYRIYKYWKRGGLKGLTATPNDVKQGLTFSRDGKTVESGTLNLNNLRPENIKAGVNIGGVAGRYRPFPRIRKDYSYLSLESNNNLFYTTGRICPGLSNENYTDYIFILEHVKQYIDGSFVNYTVLYRVNKKGGFTTEYLGGFYRHKEEGYVVGGGDVDSYKFQLIFDSNGCFRIKIYHNGEKYDKVDYLIIGI